MADNQLPPTLGKRGIVSLSPSSPPPYDTKKRRYNTTTLYFANPTETRNEYNERTTSFGKINNLFELYSVASLVSDEKRDAWKKAHQARTETERTTIASYAQGTDAWKNARKGLLTASKSLRLIGEDVGGSPKVMRDFLYPTDFSNDAIQYGIDHEDDVLEHFLQWFQTDMNSKHPDKTIKIMLERTGLVISPSHPFLGASPDAIIHVYDGSKVMFKVLVEAKCRMKYFFNWDVPSSYQWQTQFQMGVMGIDECYIIEALKGLENFRITKTKLNTSLWEWIMVPRLEFVYNELFVPLNILHEEGQTFTDGSLFIKKPRLRDILYT